MKIVFCGFGRAGKECLLQLLKEGISIDSFLVFTHNDEFNLEFIQFLENLKISYFTNSINGSVNLLKDFKGETLLSVYYKFIIKDEVLSLFEGKTMNCHPSLLPDYKGCFSSVWALLNMEEETGISFHYMVSGVDEGNIILQKRLKILKEDTAFSLYNKLISLFIQHFIEAYRLLLDDYKGIDQKEIVSNTRYYNRNLPFDGTLEIENSNDEEIEQFIKAMYFPPHPVAKFTFKGEEIPSSSIKIKNNGCLKYLKL